MRTTHHVHASIEGMLRFYENESMAGILSENGKELSDAEARSFLAKCQAKGWKLIPCGDCVGFDHFNKGCPGHPAQRELWFDFVIKNKKHWAHGFTVKRLNKVREAVLEDEYIMSDLLDRHGGEKLIPELLREKDLEIFNHAIGNFTSSILSKMIDKGIYKVKK